MDNLNSVLIEGDLINDPETSYSENNVAECIFSITTRRTVIQDDENQQEVSQFEIRTYSRIATTCSEYLRKGRGVRVVGRLKQDGEKIYIIAENVEFRPREKTKS